MPIGACAVGLIVVAIFVSSTVADDSVEVKVVKPSASPRFVIYATEEDTKPASSLFRVLRDKNKVERILKADTLDKAAASDADVLILFMPRNQLQELGPGTLEALKKKKIVGIGTDAARLFGRLGLEIKLDACAHFGNVPPNLKITKSELLGEPKSVDPIRVLDQIPEAEMDQEKYDNFAMFIPPRSPNSSVVDVLGRFSNDLNYAPVVRQGNCIMIGVAVPTNLWTEPFANLVRDACRALHERQPESFGVARRELTKPGTYEFKLAKSQSTDEPFDKAFYFRFSEPTQITATLEHAGSDSVMLLFMGQTEKRLHWVRQDARQGEKLEISTSISQQDIQELADRHWILQVTNFGANSPAECKLKIVCEKLKPTSKESLNAPE